MRQQKRPAGNTEDPQRSVSLHTTDEQRPPTETAVYSTDTGLLLRVFHRDSNGCDAGRAQRTA